MCKVEILNLFVYKQTKMAIKLSLHKYLIYTRRNWNKTFLNSNQKNDKSNKID